MENILGLNVLKLRDLNAVRFFDIDGVLCVYAFGEDGIGANLKGLSYEDFLKTTNIYQGENASDFMKFYVSHYCDREKTFILSRAYSEEEKKQKIEFIKRNYPSIDVSNIIFLESKSDKPKIARKILEEKFDGINTFHYAIDDSIDVLYDYQKEKILAIHNSSLFVIAKHNLDLQVFE